MKLHELKDTLVRITDEIGFENKIMDVMLDSIKVGDIAEELIESDFLDKSEVTSEEVKEMFGRLRATFSLMIGHSQNGNLATFVSHLMAFAITEVNVTTPNDEAKELIKKCNLIIPILRKRLMMVAMIKKLDEEIMEKYIADDDPSTLDHKDDDDDRISFADIFKKITDN